MRLILKGLAVVTLSLVGATVAVAATPVTMGVVPSFAEETASAGVDSTFKGDWKYIVGGGVATIRQYLQAALIDELHLVMRPVLLGSGEHLLNGIDLRALDYECAESTPGERATHVVLRKRV